MMCDIIPQRMKHLYFSYFFLAFSTGIVSLGVAALVFQKTRDSLVRYYIYFYIPFTLVVFCNMVLSYIGSNITDIHPTVLSTINYIESFPAKYLLMFTIPLFTHFFFAVPDRKQKNWIVGGIVLLAFLGQHFTEFLSKNPAVDDLGDYSEYSVFLLIVVYGIFIAVKYFKKLRECSRKSLAVKILVLLSVSLPGMVNDLFLADLSPLRFYPLLYCVFSLIMSHYFLKNILFRPHAEKTGAQDFDWGKYAISAREKEVVLLVLQGCSNSRIGKTLFISLNTVKTHLRNIYAKLGVSSRYELISFFSQNHPEV
jgi:DNA-binding CsgD family transcriptional regulator